MTNVSTQISNKLNMWVLVVAVIVTPAVTFGAFKALVENEIQHAVSTIARQDTRIQSLETERVDLARMLARIEAKQDAMAAKVDRMENKLDELRGK